MNFKFCYLYQFNPDKMSIYSLSCYWVIVICVVTNLFIFWFILWRRVNNIVVWSEFKPSCNGNCSPPAFVISNSAVVSVGQLDDGFLKQTNCQHTMVSYFYDLEMKWSSVMHKKLRNHIVWIKLKTHYQLRRSWAFLSLVSYSDMWIPF